ncbi:MAG: hypothetical protein JWO42_281, partial [Chloroflexi bacterium]|nr:hypothetical protein [Chloroflexota bacterium]
PSPAVLRFSAPTLADALVRLRQDIFDQAGASPRWQDGDLTRAIDRALDQYSFVMPWTQVALVPAVGGSRLYAVPTAPGATQIPGQAGAGPSWWVESVEYPTGLFPRRMVPYRELLQPLLGTPPAPGATLNGVTPGALNGTYQYVVTYLGIAGETAVSTPSASLLVPHQQTIVSLPLGPLPYCTGRNVYRTTGSGSPPYLLVAMIADNSTTSFVDTLGDGALGIPAPVADGSLNVPLLELQIADSRLPSPTNPGSLAVTYASKHVLAANGTTVPEQHHDVVLLGAAAYACLAFQVPTNDLFEYQDGELRDRVSEVKTPEHWQATGSALLALFKERLEEVKRQRDAAYAATSQWGSVPSRWQWT